MEVKKYGQHLLVDGDINELSVNLDEYIIFPFSNEEQSYSLLIKKGCNHFRVSFLNEGCYSGSNFCGKYDYRYKILIDVRKSENIYSILIFIPKNDKLTGYFNIKPTKDNIHKLMEVDRENIINGIISVKNTEFYQHVIELFKDELVEVDLLYIETLGDI